MSMGVGRCSFGCFRKNWTVPCLWGREFEDDFQRGNVWARMLMQTRGQLWSGWLFAIHTLTRLHGFNPAGQCAQHPAWKFVFRGETTQSGHNVDSESQISQCKSNIGVDSFLQPHIERGSYMDLSVHVSGTVAPKSFLGMKSSCG